MPASKQIYIAGERFWLAVEGVNKKDAVKRALAFRHAGYNARVIMTTRGKYKVWTTKPFAYLD